MQIININVMSDRNAIYVPILESVGLFLISVTSLCDIMISLCECIGCTHHCSQIFSRGVKVKVALPTRNLEHLTLAQPHPTGSWESMNPPVWKFKISRKKLHHSPTARREFLLGSNYFIFQPEYNSFHQYRTMSLV